MTDVTGKELNIDDVVYFAYRSYGDVSIGKGMITKIYDGKNRCSVRDILTGAIYTQVMSRKIYKAVD